MNLTGPGARRLFPARRLRLMLLVPVLLALAPGTFLRTQTGQRGDRAIVTVTPLAERKGVAGALTLEGVWELTSPHAYFGGFSALVAKGETGLVAATDRGFLLDLDIAGATPRAAPGSFRFVGLAWRAVRQVVDLEALARDPETGTLWAAFENDNLVIRYASAPPRARHIDAPPAMATWRENAGPETMERLADGRFMLIAEGSEPGSETLHEALLYPGDPLGPGQPQRFRFAAPARYDPVDAAQLPDGRVLILLRRVRYAIPARFDTAIAIADPRLIRADGVWRARVIQRLESGIFADNFEGIAFVPSIADPSRGAVWVISDDNFSIFQRSLLVRFDWAGTGDQFAP